MSACHKCLRHTGQRLDCRRLQAVVAKAKKTPKQSADFKAEVEAFEERLLATAAERKEEEATTQVSSCRCTLHCNCRLQILSAKRSVPASLAPLGPL